MPTSIPRVDAKSRMELLPGAKGRDGIRAKPWKLNLVSEHQGQSRTDNRKMDKDEKQERM